ncbi:MAG: pseudouridine synthase [Eubacteriales bacterium]|nr:pseudouridine synthase [Eubacteriales bacterium]
METMRLDKFLAKAGAGTRSDVKAIVRKGRVTVNGSLCQNADIKINPDSDLILMDGVRVTCQLFEYYMLYKPAGCVTAARDNLHPVVMDFIDSPKKKELFPVGRLDLDTEGLLLITNDGELAHRLLSPSKHVPKRYYARVLGNVDSTDIKAFAQGIDIGDAKASLPASLTVLSSGEESCVEVVLREGRFHQVKRMFHAVGKEVLYLKRISMGTLVLDEQLEKGEYRPLTRQEILALKGEFHE